MLITTVALLVMQSAPASDDTVLRNFTAQLHADYADANQNRWAIPLGGQHSPSLIPSVSAQSGSRNESDELSALGVSLELETSPLAFRSISRLSLIVSYDQETVIMRPGGSGVSALTRVAGEIGVADGFAGIGMSLNENGALTAGYIRQERDIRFGENSWSAESSFVGMTYRQAW